MVKKIEQTLFGEIKREAEDKGFILIDEEDHLRMNICARLTWENYFSQGERCRMTGKWAFSLSKEQEAKIERSKSHNYKYYTMYTRKRKVANSEK